MVLKALTYHVAVIVRVATIIAQKSHGVTLGNVLRVCLHKFLGALPQGWNSLDVFVETEHETVLLLVIRHKLEDIIVDIAEKLDAWLDSPVPLVVHHQGLTEKETRFEAAHVTVTDRVAINNLLLCHILANLSGSLLIYVFWEGPVLFRNLPVMCCPGDKGCCNLLECGIEGLIVQEDPVVVEFPVKAIFDLTN